MPAAVVSESHRSLLKPPPQGMFVQVHCYHVDELNCKCRWHNISCHSTLWTWCWEGFIAKYINPTLTLQMSRPWIWKSPVREGIPPYIPCRFHQQRHELHLLPQSCTNPLGSSSPTDEKPNEPLGWRAMSGKNVQTSEYFMSPIES